MGSEMFLLQVIIRFLKACLLCCYSHVGILKVCVVHRLIRKLYKESTGIVLCVFVSACVYMFFIFHSSVAKMRWFSFVRCFVIYEFQIKR